MFDPKVAGRRVYIHRDSLRLAGERNAAAGPEIAAAMWSMRVVKLINHRVFDDAEIVGLEPPEAVVRATQSITDAFWPRVTSLLRRSHIVRARNREYGDLALGGDETVTGSCFFDGYYTFATGPLAAEEMLADTRAMRDVRTGDGEHGATPLAVVRGNRLRCPGNDFLYVSLEHAQGAIAQELHVLTDLADTRLDEHWRHIMRAAAEAAERMLSRPY